MIKLEQNRLTINLLGLKIRVRINDFINNEVYQIQENGKKKRIYFAPKGLKINLFGKNSKICIPEKGNFVNVIIFSNSNSNIQIDKIHEWGMKNLILEAGFQPSGILHIVANYYSFFFNIGVTCKI